MTPSSPRLSPSDTLMAALEQVEGAEDVIIIWRKKDENGKDMVDWSINDTPFWRVLGLIETAKAEMIMDEMEPEGD